MTAPLDPTDAYIQRLTLAGDSYYGKNFRPNYAAILASGGATADDIVRINSLVNALDVAKVARMNRLANIYYEHTAQEQDYLNTLGEGGVTVPRANRDAQAAHEPTSDFWVHLGNRLARYAGQSGELVFPTTADALAGRTFSGSAEVDGGFNVGAGVMWVLDQLGRIPGFLYRTAAQSPVTNPNYFSDLSTQVQRGQEMKALGYDQGDFWDNIAFNWNHGESDFNNLAPVRAQYGGDLTDTAVAVYRYGGIDGYLSDLEAKLREGKITPDHYSASIRAMNDSQFQDVLDAVNRRHRSLGRDVARLVLPEEAEDGGWFTGISGTVDAATYLADPFLVAGRVGRSVYMLRHGLKGASDTRIYRMLGARNPHTGEVFEASDKVARAGVEDFLARNQRILAAREAGDEVTEAAEWAAMQTRHPRLVPLANEVQGRRLVWTAEERAAAERAGTQLTDINGAQHWYLQSAPITTVNEFADYLVNTAGLLRMTAGRAFRDARLVPGRAGWWAENFLGRSVLGRRSALAARADRVATRTREGLLANPAAPTLAPKAKPLVVSSLDDALRLSDEELDVDRQANRIINWDWNEQLKIAAIERGRGFHDQANGRLGLAREMRAKWEATQRRFSTLLPERRIISFNNEAAGKDIERFARTYLPKYEAARLRAIWERGTEATRRQIGKAIVMEVAEAAGMTRSTVGRRFIEKWFNDLDNANRVRYALGEQDRLIDAQGGIRRAALNMSQMEHSLVLPSFTEMKRAAAKAQLLSLDVPMSDDYARMIWEGQTRGLGDEASAGYATFREAFRDDPVFLGYQAAMYPFRTFRYALYHNIVTESLLTIAKLGFILTGSNLLRNMGEEYAAIKAGGRGSDLRAGKQLLRQSGQTSALVAAAHHLIPRVERAAIHTEEDLVNAVNRNRLRVAFGDRPLTDEEERYLAEFGELAATREDFHRVLGARDTTMPEGGLEDALEAHQSGVLMQRHSYRKPPGTEFDGYAEVPQDGGEGFEALASMYVRAFQLPEEPARRALAYLLWHEAADDAEFLRMLDESTLREMQALVPVDNDSFLEALAAVKQPIVKTIEEITPFTQRALGDPDKFWRDLVAGKYKGVHPLNQSKLREIQDQIDNLKANFPDDYQALIGDDTLATGAATFRRLASGEDVSLETLQQEVRRHATFEVLSNQLDAGRPIWYDVHGDGNFRQINSVDELLRLEDELGRGTGAMPIFEDFDNPKVWRIAKGGRRKVHRETVEVVAGHARRGRSGLIVPPGTKAIRDYVALAPETGRLRQLSEHLRTDERGYPIRPGDTDAELSAADRYVVKQVKNVAAMVADRTGQSMHPGLASRLLKGDIPAASELRRLGLEHLPKHVIQAQFLPAPMKGLDRVGTSLVKGLGRAYDLLVTNPMQRMIRKPMAVANYVRIRGQLDGYRKFLVQNGWGEEEAAKVVRDMAFGQAVMDTARFIDNPNMTSQFSVLARNWWLFQRAQEDALRRWARILKERPENLRYAQLAVNAGVQSGMIYRDQDDRLYLTLPGSGAVIEGFMYVAAALGWGDVTKVPSVDDLTTRLDFLNPSLINPIGYSASPLVTIPWDFISSLVPGSDMLKANIDYAMKGELGSSPRNRWWDAFMPTALGRFVELMQDEDDLASTVGGATASALLNATILGHVPDTSNSEAMQDFVDEVQTQSINALVGRALFAFFSPGAPSMPELYGQKEADWAWRERGYENLKDEFRSLISRVGRDNALLIWQDLHPNELIYDIGRTSTGAKGAEFAMSLDSVQWVFDNKQLFEDPSYRNVAAYFVPDNPGEFSQTAWNAMIEMQIREYKDVNQYYREILERNAVSAWFDARDVYEQERASAKARGDEVGPIDDAYDVVKQQLRTRYPILNSYFAESQQRQNRRQEQLAALYKLVDDPNVTRSQIPDIDGVGDMLQLYSDYQYARDQLRDQRSAQATAARDQIDQEYGDQMNQIIERYPSLRDLYRGVFQYLQD